MFHNTKGNAGACKCVCGTNSEKKHSISQEWMKGQRSKPSCAHNRACMCVCVCVCVCAGPPVLLRFPKPPSKAASLKQSLSQSVPEVIREEFSLK